MHDTPTPPEKLPEPGFYYHYKHDPQGTFDNYAYEVLGTARHSEDKTYGVIYRPLYENTYLDVDFSIRPLIMFMETVTKEGKEMPRFAKITDPELTQLLKERRDRMYPSTS